MSIKRKISIILLFVTALVLFTACDAKIQTDAKDYVGKNYEDVISELNRLGFNNIEQISIEDLTSEGPLEDGYVDSVVIDGNDSFKAGESFAKNSKVSITYHIIKKLNPPLGSDQIQNKNFKKIGKLFSEQGFTNVMTDEVYDLNPDKTKEKSINEIIINDVNDFSKEDEFPFDATVLIVCHYPYEKYDANVKVDFIENWFLNKYDVDFLIDGKHKTTLAHGVDMDETFNLPEGEHVFTFESTEDSDINGKTKIDITSDLEVGYEIYCHGDKIAIEEKYIDRKIELAENQLKISCSESEFTGKKYKQVVKMLQEEGFENIKTKPVYDIIFFESSKGDTKSVKIDGSSDYRRGDIFDKNAKVVVKYHLMEEDDPEIKAAEETAKKEHKELVSNIEGKSCVEVRNYLKGKGYTAEYVFETTGMDYTEYMSYAPDKELKEGEYIVTEISDVDADNKTISLKINTKSNIERLKKQEQKREKLEEYIGIVEAEGAVRQRLDKEFPYGWKIQYRLAETPESETTWFLKYQIKVKDGFKGEFYYDCEAKVKGPGSNPTVIYFIYY